MSYKGDVPAMTDVMGDQADLLFVPATAAVGFAQADKLRALAVAGDRRLAAPAPRAHDGRGGAAERDQLFMDQPGGAAMSNEPTPGTPAQPSRFIAAEVARWASYFLETRFGAAIPKRDIFRDTP